MSVSVEGFATAKLPKSKHLFMKHLGKIDATLKQVLVILQVWDVTQVHI